MQTSAAPVSMSDRINKLQKRLSLFSGDTTDGYYFQVIFPKDFHKIKSNFLKDKEMLKMFTISSQLNLHLLY